MLKSRIARSAAALCVALMAPFASLSPRAQTTQMQTDEYIHIDLSTPATSTFRVMYEVSATSAGATMYSDPIKTGTVVTQVVATDLMSGRPLTVATTPTSLNVTLARPVPKDGQG